MVGAARADSNPSYNGQEAYSVPIFSFSRESLDLRPKFTTGAMIFLPSRKDLFVQRSPGGYTLMSDGNFSR